MGVVNGVAEVAWTLSSFFTAVFGFAVAFALWWLYFDNVDGSAIWAAREEGRTGRYQAWLHGHLPLVIGLAALGVGVEHLVGALATELSAAKRLLVYV